MGAAGSLGVGAGRADGQDMDGNIIGFVSRNSNVGLLAFRRAAAGTAARRVRGGTPLLRLLRDQGEGWWSDEKRRRRCRSADAVQGVGQRRGWQGLDV
jgi:hypothetical protein